MPWQVQVRSGRHVSRPMLCHLFQRHRHAMEISHRFWPGDCEGFGNGNAGGHRSMRIHGGRRSAAMRDPKVRLRGLSEIATNPPLLLLAAMAAGSGGGSRNQVRTPTEFPARLSSPIKADPPINLTHRATVTAKLARRSSGN